MLRGRALMKCRFIDGCIFVSVVMAILMPLSAHAGAWNQSPGDGLIISTFDYSRASRAFTDLDTEQQVIDFTKNELGLFYEHGLTKKLTFIGSGTHQTLQVNRAEGPINFADFGNVELGLRYQLAQRGGFVVSLQGSYIIGGGPPEPSLGSLGSKNSIELRGLLGQSKKFEKFELFVDMQAAMRLRGGEDFDQWRGDFTLGLKTEKKVMFLGQIFHTDRAASSRDGFLAPRQSQTKVKASIVYEFRKNRHVQLGYQETVAGRNIVREQGLSVGTWIRY